MTKEEFLSIYSDICYKVQFLDGSDANIDFREALENNLPCYYMIMDNLNLIPLNYIGRIKDDEYVITKTKNGNVFKLYVKEHLKMTSKEQKIHDYYKFLQIV